MNNPLTNFVFETDEGSTRAVRVVMIDGEPWFVAADVASALTIGRTDDAVARLDDDEKGTATVRTPGGEQQMTIINESGLYSLILTSRKPEAKKFKKWVTSEVLPTIRKTGRYVDPLAPPEPPHAMPGMDGQLFLSHRADILVAADRAFRAAMRSARQMGMGGVASIRQANDIARQKTGVDMLAELNAEAHVQGLEAQEAHAAQQAAHRQTGEAVANARMGQSRENVGAFWRAWAGGQLTIPYQSCQTSQAYRAYQHWCEHTGRECLEPHGEFTRWATHISHLEGKPMRVAVMKAHGGPAFRMLLASRPPREGQGAWARAMSEEFAAHLHRFARRNAAASA